MTVCECLCKIFFNYSFLQNLNIVVKFGLLPAEKNPLEDVLFQPADNAEIEERRDQHEHEAEERDDGGVVQEVAVELPLGELGQVSEFIPVL